MGAWAVTLNGVTLTGGTTSAVTGTVHGCLTEPPDGMGAPMIRTEDVTYPQRDGVRHFSDWYLPRIITLSNVSVCPDGCNACPSAREKVRAILGAWSRRCDDTELVIFTDCHGTSEDRAVVGPYGVVGRPRVAQVTWLPGGTGCASVLLRFDAKDQRLLILNDIGTPGSGQECLTLTPAVSVFCRTYDRCYTGPSSGFCYDTDISTPGSGPVSGLVSGDLCVSPTITLTGLLTSPVIENVVTGETIGYDGTIAAGSTVVIDTETGTATEEGASRTHLLSGDPRLLLSPGDVILRMTATNISDDGEAQICWRPAVLSG